MIHIRPYREKRKIIQRDGQLYMTRWYIFDTPWFGVKLHKIVLSDHECVHDHPWDFISIILKGGYIEHVEKEVLGSQSVDDSDVSIKKSSKIYHPGSILFRKAEHRHRLEIHQPAWTLVITLKRRRKWGFWTKTGWMHWKIFDSTQHCD